ncbi:unnamed protein product [Symbiodinium natans]|uniref:Cyclic nucleotide-binding domain-containing protein n=1 Tax=Symbiodinium natans TaxID=878477 RepID=A0A812IKC6_9DINO|nr:unnamed protein product [Symbiodinium natans]
MSSSSNATADAFGTYYQCRLEEVTSKCLEQSYPRLTSAQAALGSKKRLVQQVSPISRDGRKAGEKKFGHSFSDVQRDAVKHWQSEVSDNTTGLSAKVKDRMVKRLTQVRRAITPLPAMQGDGNNSKQDFNRQERMVRVLKDSRFFMGLDAVILESLPNYSEFLTLDSGTVLFRQGDAAKGCYVIVTGKVGFYVGGNLKSPRQPVTPAKEIPLTAESQRRVLTFEGFSTCSKMSDLGTCVKKSGAGEVFGELALMDDSQPRRAAARCLDECEVLFVSAAGFEEVKQYVKDLEKQKREFLELLIFGRLDPKDIVGAYGHPASCFHQQKHTKGRALLKQGTNEHKVIFIVVSGELEMTRHAGKPGSSLREVLAILGTGDMCGSLGFALKQPYSVRVHSEACEILASRHEDLDRLPESILQRIMARLSAETAERLRYGYVSKPMGWQNVPKLQKRTRQDSELLLLNSRDLQTHLLARLWQSGGQGKQMA